MAQKHRPWFTSGGYKHLDMPIGEAFAEKTASAHFVAAHSWLPLIKYTKRVKRYKPMEGKTPYKNRPIMYASHRDACILKRYARAVSALLEREYARTGLHKTVIAYRALGKTNYHFAADAQRFAKAAMPCIVLCFDITGFFDHLDHQILKRRLKFLLGVEELPRDWYAVFRTVTQYRAIERDQLQGHPVFGPRFAKRRPSPVATIAEVKSAGIPIEFNNNKFGIPQGTPISSVLSNLYLIEFDKTVMAAAVACGALYQRYSDDIILIVPEASEAKLRSLVETTLADHRLALASEKTDRQRFDATADSAFQYLGFNISPHGAVIRPNSLARQWRKAKRAIHVTKKAGLDAIAKGKSKKIFVSKLRRRFSPVGSRNFSSYSRRADEAFGSKKISRQVARLERRIDAEIRRLQKLST